MGIFRQFGDTLASGGKSAEKISEGLGKAIGDLGQNLVGAYRTRHETIHDREQHEFMLQYLEDHARVAERAAQAEFQRGRAAAQHAAALEAAAAERAHAHDLELQAHHAWWEVMKQAQLDRLEIDRVNNPFSYDYDRIRNYALQASGGGERPVLLIAPFYSDVLEISAADAKPTQFIFPLSHAWDRSPLRDDMGTLRGALSRPLRLQDVDIHTLRQVLGDIPTVLIHGDIEAGRRLWIHVIGWGLIPDSRVGASSEADEGSAAGITAADAFRFDLPPVDLPEESASPAEMLAFRDEVADETVLVAGVFAEWFHVARGRRRPALHRSLPEAASELGDPVAEISAAMLAIAADQDLISGVSAELAQARTYMDRGWSDLAGAALARAVTGLRRAEPDDSRLFLDQAREAIALLREAGEDAAATEIEALARDVARTEILRRTPWGE